MILILSSYVASSPVGGGAQVRALLGLRMPSVLVPTTMFGRHPGLGPPGGAPVSMETFTGMLAGVEANGVFPQVRAVITGYFADAEQVAAAEQAILAVRGANSKALIVVDPIMGDTARGLYVNEAVADSIATRLVKHADIVTPNVWELERLTGAAVTDLASARKAAESLGRSALVSSVDAGDRMGVMWVDNSRAWLAAHARAPQAVNGSGDLLCALFTAHRLLGADAGMALGPATTAAAAMAHGRSVGVTTRAMT